MRYSRTSWKTSYYRAVERAACPVSSGCISACAKSRVGRRGTRLLTDYRLDTTLSGPLRRITNALTALVPRLLRQRMLGSGSPVAEVCHLGFAAGSGSAEQGHWLDARSRRPKPTPHSSGCR